MIKVYYIISYPIARGLDKLLGVHDTSKLKRRDFLELINYKKKVTYLHNPLELASPSINNNDKSILCRRAFYECLANNDSNQLSFYS